MIIMKKVVTDCKDALRKTAYAGKYKQGAVAEQMDMPAGELTKRLGDAYNLPLGWDHGISMMLIRQDPSPIFPVLEALGWEIPRKKTNSELSADLSEAVQTVSKAVEHFELLVERVNASK